MASNNNRDSWSQDHASLRHANTLINIIITCYAAHTAPVSVNIDRNEKATYMIASLWLSSDRLRMEYKE
jgi:hypothetical protein